MKVLKIKEGSTLQFPIIRGNNVIDPAIDGNGNYIFGHNVFTDPVYADLVPKLMEECEIIDFVPLPEDFVKKSGILSKLVDYGKKIFNIK